MIIIGFLVGAALAAGITLIFGVYTIGPTERGIIFEAQLNHGGTESTEVNIRKLSEKSLPRRRIDSVRPFFYKPYSL